MADKSSPVREPPPELKLIKQFVLRGNQLRSIEPVIAYYCCPPAPQIEKREKGITNGRRWVNTGYFWSVRQILANNLHHASTACTTWTADLMDELERVFPCLLICTLGAGLMGVAQGRAER